jgi:Trk-type K+ transport system membrane component
VYHRTERERYDAAPDDAQRDVYREQVVETPGDRYAYSEHVSVPSEAERRAATAERIKQVIYFIFGAVCVLLAARFVLLLLGANPASPFVSFIYGLSGVFALPFTGIFGEPSFNASVLEWSSLVGIVVYSLVAWGLTKLVDVSYAPARRTYDV